MMIDVLRGLLNTSLRGTISIPKAPDDTVDELLFNSWLWHLWLNADYLHRLKRCDVCNDIKAYLIEKGVRENMVKKTVKRTVTKKSGTRRTAK